MSNTKDCEAEAPRVLGVTMSKPADNNDAWSVDFHSLSAWIELAGDTWDGFVGDTCVACGEMQAEAVAAIERELLAIRAAIPAPSTEPQAEPSSFPVQFATHVAELMRAEVRRIALLRPELTAEPSQDSSDDGPSKQR